MANFLFYWRKLRRYKCNKYIFLLGINISNTQHNSLAIFPLINFRLTHGERAQTETDEGGKMIAVSIILDNFKEQISANLSTWLTLGIVRMQIHFLRLIAILCHQSSPSYIMFYSSLLPICWSKWTWKVGGNGVKVGIVTAEIMNVK